MKRSRIETGCISTRDWLGTDAKVVRHVRVCGDGHLAVATRIELNRLGIQRDSDYLLPSLRPDLVIACADSETDQSFHPPVQRAINEGSPLLFGCLVGRVLRLGPLIDPSTCFVVIDPTQEVMESPLHELTDLAHETIDPMHQSSAPSHTPARDPYAPEADAAPYAAARTETPRPGVAEPRVTETPRPGVAEAPHPGVAEADPPLNLYARLGALLISAQALNFLLGARNQCIRDRAVEFNPWSMESKAYRVFKVRQ